MTKDLPDSEVFATFFHLSPNLSCVANQDAVFEFLSPNWESTLGWAIEKLTSLPFLHFVHVDDLDRTLSEMKKLGDGRTTLDFENRYKTKSGTYVTLNWNAIFHKGRYYAVAKDVTKLRGLEAIEMQSRASASLALIGEMTCGIAHELSTPLAIVTESIEIAKEASSPNELKKMLLMMENASKQMAHIVRGMRMVAGPAATADPKIVSLREIVSQAEIFFRSKLNRDDVTFTNSVEESVLISVVPGDVLQILINLIANSHFALSTASPLLRRIEISSVTKSSVVMVYVADSGSGIATSIADRIMDPFFTTKNASDGAGLGLSISKRLATQNGGKLYLSTSAPHTEFVLELPASSDPR